MLDEQGVSGLILFNVGAVIKQIPQQLIDVCNELNFPLIVMPLDVSYYEILSMILDQLLQYQNQKLKSSIDIYDRLIAHMLDMHDYSALITTLHEIIGHDILYFDHNKKCICKTGPGIPDDLLSRLSDQMQSYTISFVRNTDVFQLETCSGIPVIYVPVARRNSFYGVIVVLGAKSYSEMDRIALTQTKNLLCITAFNQISIAEFHDRLRLEYFTDVLNGRFIDENNILTRGHELGYNIRDVYCVMVIDVFQKAGQENGLSCDIQRSEGNDAIVDKFCAEVKKLVSEHIVIQLYNQIIILCLGFSGKKAPYSNLIHSGNILINSIRNKYNTDVSVGIGTYCNSVRDVEGSFRKAQTAILLANRLYHEPRCSCYESLRIYDLLYQNLSHDNSSQIIYALLEPIQIYDHDHGTELEQTLKLLITYNLNVSVVAEKMFIHKNTVLQRKKKICSLYKEDPFTPEKRGQFEIAFLLQSLFATAPS
jgi:sugar diacid utilization regulator